MKKWFYRAILFSVGGVLLWYTLRNISLPDLLAQFRQANYAWVALSGLLIALNGVLKALRWKLMLPVNDPPVRLRATYASLQAGIFTGTLLPGSGELARCESLRRTNGVLLTRALGSIIAERVIEAIMLSVLMLILLGLEYNRVITFFGEHFSGTSLLYGKLLPLALLAGVAYLAFYALNRFMVLSENHFIQWLYRLGRELKSGLLSTLHLKHPGLFIALNLLVHGINFLTYYALLLSLSLSAGLPPSSALLIIVVNSLGSIALPTQGGFGTFHFLVSHALLLYQLPLAEGIVLATFMHSVQFMFTFSLAGLGMVQTFFLLAARPAAPQINQLL